MRFDRLFFKEFTVQLEAPVPELLSELLRQGYHAGLPLGRWYPSLANCMSIAVTEKRTRAEIDGLAGAYKSTIGKKSLACASG
jgi:glycine dehydrogenase subunit 1